MSDLYFFKSGKETDDPVSPYKHQLFISIKKEKILTLIKNIAEKADNSKDDESIELGFAGEMS